MRVLYVGFKGKNNTSFRLVSSLTGERLFLTNSFAGAARDIDGASAAYDLVLLFGLDKDLSGAVRIEERAERQGEVLRTACDVRQLAEIFDCGGVGCGVSQRPTQYLCNAAYYRLLKKTKGKAVLIHIPGKRHMTEELMAGIIKSLGGVPCPSFPNR